VRFATIEAISSRVALDSPKVGTALACVCHVRIAQVSPLYESVPPQGYGGTERVVHVLTEQLVAMGHDVTLFASGDSQTRARLVAGSPRSLRQAPDCHDPLAWHQLQLAQIARQVQDFDVVHFHVDYLHFALSRALRLPQLTTLHGRLDLPDLPPLYAEFSDMPLVSISNAQRAPLPGANWLGTVYHGLDSTPGVFVPQPEEYLAFVGRVSREKRPDRAVEIARALSMKLKVAAKIDPSDEAYWRDEIAPLFEDPLVEFLGERSEPEKLQLMGRARAVLMPIDWPEPFGLVVIEAMACGTPVMAFRRGSMPEVIDDGVSGVLVDDMHEAPAAARRAMTLPREGVREAFVRRFTAQRMALDYVNVYENLLERRAGARGTQAA
jgi:glycosyltransferase involved in cell wall biosynthesis